MNKSLLLATLVLVALVESGSADDLEKKFQEIDEHLSPKCTSETDPEDLMDEAVEWLDQHKKRYIKRFGQPLEEALKKLTSLKKVVNEDNCDGKGKEIIRKVTDAFGDSYEKHNPCGLIASHYAKKLDDYCATIAFNSNEALTKLTTAYQRDSYLVKFSESLAKLFVESIYLNSDSYSIDFKKGKFEPKLGTSELVKLLRKDNINTVVNMYAIEKFKTREAMSKYKNYLEMGGFDRYALVGFAFDLHVRDPCRELIKSLDSVFLPENWKKLDVVKRPPTSDFYQLSEVVFRICKQVDEDENAHIRKFMDSIERILKSKSSR